MSVRAEVRQTVSGLPVTEKLQTERKVLLRASHHGFLVPTANGRGSLFKFISHCWGNKEGRRGQCALSPLGLPSCPSLSH